MSQSGALNDREASEKERAHWDDESTNDLIDIFVEMIEAGDRTGTKISSDEWNRISNAFKKTGKTFTPAQLKNKRDYLKKVWQYGRKLECKGTGKGPDPVCDTTRANNELKKKSEEIEQRTKYHKPWLKYGGKLKILHDRETGTGNEDTETDTVEASDEVKLSSNTGEKRSREHICGACNAKLEQYKDERIAFAESQIKCQNDQIQRLQEEASKDKEELRRVEMENTNLKNLQNTLFWAFDSIEELLNKSMESQR